MKKNKLPPAIQEYYNRKLLGTYEQEKEEELRLGRPLTHLDRVRLMVNGAITQANLIEIFKE